MDKSFSNKGAQQENGGIKPPEESGISSFAQHSLFTNGGVGEEKGCSKEVKTVFYFWIVYLEKKLNCETALIDLIHMYVYCILFI